MLLRYIIVMVVFVLIIDFSSAYGLGLSPAELGFDINSKNKSCSKIVLISQDYRGDIAVSDVWDDGSGNYSFNAGDNGLKVSYTKEFSVVRKKTLNVCVSGKQDGSFKGFLLFKALNGSLEVGGKLFVNVSGMNAGAADNEENLTSLVEEDMGLTGAAILTGEENFDFSFWGIIAVEEVFLLGSAGFFAFAVARKVRKRKEDT